MIGLALAVGGALYYAVPFVVWQWANAGVTRRGSGAYPETALTFDDGPDPATTPAVLDALEAAGATATFFLLGEKALAYPELTREIARRGHEIGCHGFRHRHAFLRTPWGIVGDTERGAAAIGRVTGARPHRFRPAHGAYTLATVLALRRSRLAPVHWTLESRDWHPAFSAAQVRERVIREMEPGAIVCLHDAGPGAKTTVPLLPFLLADLQTRGYQIVSVEKMRGLQSGGLRDAVIRLWRVVEGVFDRAAGIDSFTSEHAECVFRVSLSRYYGPPLTLPDGTRLCPGDQAAEMHLHSARIQAVAAARPRALLRLIRRSFLVMARVAEEHPRYRAVRVFFGASLRPGLYTPLGCFVADLPQKRPFFARYLRFLRAVYGARRSRQLLEPKIVWMDRKTLVKKYGEKMP